MTNGDLFRWGSPIERERRRRIRLCLWAYAYEIANAPIASDEQFDREAMASDPTIETGKFDDWWRANFVPYSGQWINSHPDLPGLKRLYDDFANTLQR